MLVIRDLRCAKGTFLGAYPALPHAEHGTTSSTVVKIHSSINTMARIICIVFLPITLKNLFVNRIVLRVFPALQRATIDMGAKRKPSITGKTDTEPVSIGEGVFDRNLGGGR